MPVATHLASFSLLRISVSALRHRPGASQSNTMTLGEGPAASTSKVRQSSHVWLTTKSGWASMNWLSAESTLGCRSMMKTRQGVTIAIRIYITFRVEAVTVRTPNLILADWLALPAG